METATRTGRLSVHTENLFPIIRQFLYQNQEVFLRELVANAVDASRKLEALAAAGKLTDPVGHTHIQILLDPAARTLTIRDRGIGLTMDEADKYLNQIAFSSAEEFLNQYKDTGAQLIGHFGMGFYSAFMVAQKVEVHSLSWQPGATAVHWVNEGTTEYVLEPGTRTERGTDVVLHIDPEHEEYLQAPRIRAILEQHCRFLPVPIEFEGKVINTTQPAWTKKPTELTDEDYRNFYQELYPMEEAPLFWVHLNVDYPFTLTGILYFPKLKPGVEVRRNQIQLYSNQVYITDHVEDVVPEYLTLLQGVIDSPDIPLNVGRSALQANAHVRKIAGHIAKKVADKLRELFRDDRPAFESKWESLGLFVKYGMLRDEDFYRQAETFALVKDTQDAYHTLAEFREATAPLQTDKHGRVVHLYTTDPEGQHSYVQAATRRGYRVLVMDAFLDSPWLAHLEHKLEKTLWARVDADALDKLIDTGIAKASLYNEAEEKELKQDVEAVASQPGVNVTLQPLGEEELPLVITRPEHLRRLQEMAQLQGSGSIPGLTDGYTVVLNTGHTFYKSLLLTPGGPDRTRRIQHLLDLARLQQGLLKGDALTSFIQKSLGGV